LRNNPRNGVCKVAPPSRRRARRLCSSLSRLLAGTGHAGIFLTELTLDPPDATSDEAGAPLLDEDYLILSTIHSAKGQEWRSLFVLNVVDGRIPSDLAAGTTAEIEEERRLLYVAVTRARDELHLLVPQRFFTHGQSAYGDRHVVEQATVARDVPAGERWTFADHRTMAEIIADEKAA